MKRFFITFIKLFVISVIIASCSDSINWEKETTDYPVGETIYEMQLLPGMKASGWKYFWKEEGPSVGCFQEFPDMGWIELPQPCFSSMGCDDLGSIRFDFIAPLTTGEYVAKVGDGDAGWPETKFSMVVTNNPVINTFNKTVTLNPGDTFVFSDNARWAGINTTGWGWCVPKPFYPSHQQRIQIGTNAPSAIIKIEPSDFTISANETKQYKIKIFYDKPGVYVYYTYFLFEWMRNPSYFKWTITMK